MIRAALLLAICLAAAAPAQSRPMLPRPLPAAEGVPSWAELSPRQQADLVLLKPRWDRMPPAKRARVLERWQRWQQVPPERRQALREGRRNFASLSPRQREGMRESLRALRRLPPQEQQRLRALWRDMSPEQRREWLRRGGPGLAAPP